MTRPKHEKVKNERISNVLRLVRVRKHEASRYHRGQILFDLNNEVISGSKALNYNAYG